MTIEEIAELAGVSRSTVSRVLNDQPNVRKQVRDRVLAVMHEHGYVPQAAARSLARRRTQVICLLIPDTTAGIFGDPFFGYVIGYISEACANAGYFLMLAMVTPDRERGFYERIIRSRHFDGLIMLSSDIDDPILPRIMKDQLPFVLFGSHPYFDDLSWVDADQQRGARAAVLHLVGLGHQRIATITGPMSMAAAIERRDGYKQGMLEAGLPIDQQLIVEGAWTEQGGYAAMRQLLALPTPPTAVFVASDTMTVGAIRVVGEAGLRIPDDLALVSFDDLPLAQFANPPLTTVRQPIADMCASAVRLLVAQIEQDTSEKIHVRLPTTLVQRVSCGALQSQLTQAS